MKSLVYNQPDIVWIIYDGYILFFWFPYIFILTLAWRFCNFLCPNIELSETAYVYVCLLIFLSVRLSEWMGGWLAGWMD